MTTAPVTIPQLRPARVAADGWGWRHAGRRAWAVRSLDLAIEPGERVLLLGASGSGKSTLLAGLAGLLDADSGESAGRLTLDGQAAHTARHRSGLVLQDPETQLVMGRAGDDVAFGPENYAVPREQIWRRVDEALELVGFGYDRDRPTAALSGGEKQRLALAGVLAIRPGLLLLDEPTANLDPDGAAAVRDAVARVVATSGATLVVVEHRVELWSRVVDRVVVLGPDGVIADGPPGTVFLAAAPVLRAAGVWLPGADTGRSVPAAAAGRPVLEARAVRVRYPGSSADSLAADLTLSAGQVSAVVGPNGSGKSTLASVVAGLRRPSSGAAYAAGDPRPLHRLRARSLARIVGTVFQEPEHQFLTSRVRDELALAPRRLRRSGAETDARVDELLDRLGLTALAEANPFTLSGGQKRRLSVATALSAAPPVLVLDEPTFGQDARTWAELVDLLTEVKDGGTAMLVVSHDLDFVRRLADRTVRMTGGHLAEMQQAAR